MYLSSILYKFIILLRTAKKIKLKYRFKNTIMWNIYPTSKEGASRACPVYYINRELPDKAALNLYNNQNN